MVRKSAAGDAALTVSALAKRFGLARSTLLHYHRIQLLKPSGRSPGGYRIYGPEAVERLTRIRELRQAGLPLRAIKRVLDTSAPLAEVLEQHIGVLNRQVAQLRIQQGALLSLLDLASKPGARSHRALTRQSWTQMFQAIGMSDADMRQWHVNFETRMPEAHADFLHSLGLSAEEIRRIRAWSAR
jgi:DNA-binding transcriptional MerR regulator